MRVLKNDLVGETAPSYDADYFIPYAFKAPEFYHGILSQFYVLRGWPSLCRAIQLKKHQRIRHQ
jgi:hypothetical protein